MYICICICMYKYVNGVGWGRSAKGRGYGLKSCCFSTDLSIKKRFYSNFWKTMKTSFFSHIRDKKKYDNIGKNFPELVFFDTEKFRTMQWKVTESWWLFFEKQTINNKIHLCDRKSYFTYFFSNFKCLSSFYVKLTFFSNFLGYLNFIKFIWFMWKIHYINHIEFIHLFLN